MSYIPIAECRPPIPKLKLTEFGETCTRRANIVCLMDNMNMDPWRRPPGHKCSKPENINKSSLKGRHGYRKTSRKESKFRKDGRKFMSPLRGLPAKFNELSIIITSLRDFSKVSNTCGLPACALPLLVLQFQEVNLK